MKILPVHLLKLRWLLSQIENLKQHDATYIKDITQALQDVNYEEAHPITIFMIESFYDSYKAFLKGAA